MTYKYDCYLITGATGYLGKGVVSKFIKAGKHVRALVLPHDTVAKELPFGTELCYGSVDDAASMQSFFAGDLSNACLIHCAGIVSIATRPNPLLWEVNVKGTKNVMQLAFERGVAKVVHVSSVHAIPEKKKHEQMCEVSHFSKKNVIGQYAKSKAEGTQAVLEYAKLGLNVSIVHPSGLIGPYDQGKSNAAYSIISYCNDKLPAAVSGGYDFVDVRDVIEGIALCSEKGERGECYILSGHYASIPHIFKILKKEGYGKRIPSLPLWFMKILSPFFELHSVVRKQPLYLTPYSAYTLGSNSSFSRKKAAEKLGYRPRPLSDTLHDMVRYLADSGIIRKR